MEPETARIDAIVPTIKGREASLERATKSLRLRDDVNVIVVPDAKNCGWGWIQGICASKAPYLLLATDDQEYPDPTWADVAIETVEAGCLPCPRVAYPDGRWESQGGDMNALHNLNRQPLKDWTPVDYSPIPFASAGQISRIGMISTQYAGDVWVSYRARQLGIGTVLRQGWITVHHYEQVGRGAGMSQFDRDQLDQQTLREELAKHEPPWPSLAVPRQAAPSHVSPSHVTTNSGG